MNNPGIYTIKFEYSIKCIFIFHEWFDGIPLVLSIRSDLKIIVKQRKNRKIIQNESTNFRNLMKIKMNIFQKYLYVAVQNVRTRINVLFCKQNWNRKMQNKNQILMKSSGVINDLFIQSSSSRAKPYVRISDSVRSSRFLSQKKISNSWIDEKENETFMKNHTRFQFSLYSMWFSFSLKENAILWNRVISYVF